MGKASRQKRRSAVTAARRSRTNYGWYAATAAVVVLGVVLVAFSAANKEDAVAPFANDDHWHAALGINVCGTWQPNAPEFAQRFGSQLTAGIHSHGDGLVHIHPYTSDESGERATLGRFFDNGGWDVSADSFSVWGGIERANGDDDCSGEEATVRWSVNGEEQEGDPADYRPEDLDVVAIAFLPADAEIGKPPSAANVTSPSDVEGEAPETTLPSDTTPPADTTPPDETGDTTPTSAPADTTAP